MMQSARNDEGLVRLYGYQQLQQTYGWRRRTLENAMRLGKLRRPMIVGKRACWTASDIDDYLIRLRGDLELLAVDSPDKIPDEKLPDALEALATRFLGLHGEQLAPGDVLSVGVQRPLTDEQLSAIAHNAAAKQRELVEGILTQLDGLHIVEAMILQRAFLPPLRRFADEGLKQFGIDITMTDSEWREAGMLIVDRVINGETLPPETHPRDVVEALANDGVLSGSAKQ